MRMISYPNICNSSVSSECWHAQAWVLFCELYHPFLFVFEGVPFRQMDFFHFFNVSFLWLACKLTHQKQEKYYNKCIKSGNYHNRVPISVCCFVSASSGASWPGCNCQWELVLNWPFWLNKGYNNKNNTNITTNIRYVPIKYKSKHLCNNN